MKTILDSRSQAHSKVSHNEEGHNIYSVVAWVLGLFFFNLMFLGCYVFINLVNPNFASLTRLFPRTKSSVNQGVGVAVSKPLVLLSRFSNYKWTLVSGVEIRFIEK